MSSFVKAKFRLSGGGGGEGGGGGGGGGGGLRAIFGKMHLCKNILIQAYTLLFSFFFDCGLTAR